MMVCSCAPFDLNKIEVIVEGLSTGIVHVQSYERPTEMIELPQPL
jgi:hypothetical protein